MPEIQIGAPYCFTPSAFTAEKAGQLPEQREIPRKVNGRVGYINEAHRFFRVDYVVDDYHLCECFKF